ncbi:MAG: hypothetical protein EAZ91_11815 [Cytophagales bacterium]|nr:MAG: hypothetical protein EAZ91_11815 [Cytophagales bacterium]
MGCFVIPRNEGSTRLKVNIWVGGVDPSFLGMTKVSSGKLVKSVIIEKPLLFAKRRGFSMITL